MEKKEFSKIRLYPGKTQGQMAMKKLLPKKAKPCWETQKCSVETKRSCPAWEFRAGHLCWFINGTICNGEIQESWRKKMKICQQCVVFQAMFPSLRIMPEELISKVTQ